jgi:phosphate/sulfate permease
MFEHVLGCLKWAAVGFVVAFVLMRLYEASHIHDDIPRPEFKKRQSKRAALVLSTFAAILSAMVWLLVQKWD